MARANLVLSTLFLVGISLLILAPANTIASPFCDFFPKIILNVTGKICCTETGACESEDEPGVGGVLISIYDKHNGTGIGTRIAIHKGNDDGRYGLHIPEHTRNFVWVLMSSLTLKANVPVQNCTKLKVKGTALAPFIRFDLVPKLGVYYGTPQLI